MLYNVVAIQLIDKKQTQIIWKNYTIECTVTKDGRIISMRHFFKVDVRALLKVKPSKHLIGSSMLILCNTRIIMTLNINLV